ncbi:hypothetical protein [Kitasatospora purpeofusca]|uniref:hypothetical protein n=1 Tax=Kitasatospora purpeofusca TaxID=67352 RepID=UPI002A5AFB3F|nr:hypothetical protein [Kitasatospora purpeofusca]MDY0815656.1 hypothetical protein [Kitasatospora purpeofusca]
MTRFSRSLAVLAVTASAVIGGISVAPGASAAGKRCDVEYTVAYYTYKQLGYGDLEALLHAEKSYGLCQVQG